jgi:DNA topoisomerase-2
VHGLVNGASSIGEHVNHVAGSIVSGLGPLVKKKRGGKDVIVRMRVLLAHCHLVVVARVSKPSWSSQVKRELDSFEFIKVAGKDSRYKPSEDFLKKLAASPVVEALIVSEGAKATVKAAKESDGRKVSTLNVPKLRDAKWAGTSKSARTTLILTEGDSALTFAVAGLSELGFDEWGAFPLKGKIMNAREASSKQLAGNEEIKNIKKILGLQAGVDSAARLRYGRVVVLTDADYDGSHIRGLFLNFLHNGWPELCKSGYVCVIPTPVIRVTRAREKIDFFSVREFKTWEEEQERRGWQIKYAKGLGTWKSNDAKEILVRVKPVRFVDSPETDDAIMLAFAKDRVTDRKKWIMDAVAVPPAPLSYGSDIPIHKYINEDLVNYSVYSVATKIPSLVDGMKRSQVKVLFSVLKGGFVGQAHSIKVAQLGARTAEKTHYSHGEKSLFDTIIGMAQGFAGANNVPLLVADGQFGCA